jgi:2-C-methyl-D-erythritol 4-phosphate cytidylyltransferase
MKVSAIIPVAGQGKRFSSSIPKQYLEIDGQSIIAITIKKILSICDNLKGVVVVAKTEMERTASIFDNIEGFKENFKIVLGGEERQDSVYNGLINLNTDSEIVIVHDGVRPLVSRDILIESIRVAKKTGACIAAVPVKDTIKRTHDNKIIETVFRSNLWHAQTPQTFKYSILFQAHKIAQLDNFYGTDESALVERMGHPVSIIRGDYSNIKITTVEDLEIVHMLMKSGVAI